MTDKTQDQDQKLTCEFTLDEQGRPVVVCPDAESQDQAFKAMEQYPDISVRVAPKPEEKPAS